MTKRKVLIVSNDSLTQKSLYEMLCREGYETEVADSVKDALTAFHEKLWQVALLDIDAIKNGIELIRTIREKKYPAEAIILTSYGNIENILSNTKVEAFDYLVRPIDDKKIVSAIERALSAVPRIENKQSFINKLLHKDPTYHGLVGKSQVMSDMYSLIERISNSKATVLLRGESGTGKRMIARAIHCADKKRRNKPFIEISCGALPREIIESELFGHMKGSFTGAINDRKGRFELADSGTILLDDIDSFSLDLQVKLLRVLQHKEFERVGDHKTVKVDVRIVVATNQDLEQIVAEKKFREDLYYRLNVISVNIPPLRSRKDDIPLLVSHFINFYSKENNKKMKGVSEEALGILSSHNWPGNIRELENIIERAVILDTDEIIEADDLPEILENTSAVLNPISLNDPIKDTASLKDALKEPEKVYILQVLKEVGWNKNKAARKLGVNRTTLYNKLKKYNLVEYLDGGKKAQ